MARLQERCREETLLNSAGAGNTLLAVGNGRRFRSAAGAHLSHAGSLGAVLDRAGAVAARNPETALHRAGTYQLARASSLRNHCLARIPAGLPERHHLVRGLVLLGVSRDACLWRIERARRGGRAHLVLSLSRALSRNFRGPAGARSAQPQPRIAQWAATGAILVG